MEPQDVILSWRKMEPGTREALLVSGALLLVIFLILVWAIFLRRPSRHHHRHSQHHTHASAQGNPGEETEKATVSPKGRKWRRRRREHRPRNPTLSETGGLPPVRSEGPPAPPP